MAKGVRRTIYFRRDVDERLRELAASIGRGKGETVDVLFDRADGNLQTLRHACRQPLAAVGLTCCEIRAARRDHQPIELHLQTIERLIDEMTAILARPETAPKPTAPG